MSSLAALDGFLLTHFELLDEQSTDFDLAAVEAELADFNASFAGVVEWFNDEMAALSAEEQAAVLCYLENTATSRCWRCWASSRRQPAVRPATARWPTGITCTPTSGARWRRTTPLWRMPPVWGSCWPAEHRDHAGGCRQVACHFRQRGGYLHSDRPVRTAGPNVPAVPECPPPGRTSRLAWTADSLPRSRS